MKLYTLIILSICLVFSSCTKKDNSKIDRTYTNWVKVSENRLKDINIVDELVIEQFMNPCYNVEFKGNSVRSEVLSVRSYIKVDLEYQYDGYLDEPHIFILGSEVTSGKSKQDVLDKISNKLKDYGK